MGVFPMLATILAAGVAIVAAVAAGYFHLPRLAYATQIGIVSWATVYTGLLVSTSMRSHARVLAPGNVKRFCGFYLDCHMGAAVVDVRRTPFLGAPPNEVRAAGDFYVVTLHVTSDAGRAMLSLDNPQAVIVDSHGHVYQRSALGERALANAVGPAIPLHQPVPGGSHFTTPVVFDLPPDVREPKLLLTDGSPIARVIEQFLIGDEDSFLHKRTYHALTAASATAGQRHPSSE